jgi:hypothetical protein
MFTKEFLRKHPLSVEVVKALFKQRALDAFNDMDALLEVKEDIMQIALGDNSILLSLNDNPCIYFEIFDSYDIHFCVMPYRKEGKVFYQIRDLADSEIPQHYIEYKSRKKAEYIAIRDAFDILETRLLAKKELES